ncbi:UxaA family hydrolase [Xanthobacter pseudotagetidis]|uniref:UxaA family hydrolase n=1 Tax=Xanthobacter pseudotagetidis TaxID=3119911 RepID=UPI003727BEA2
MPRAIVLDPSDNVATLIDPARKAEAATLGGARSGTVTLAADVPFGHKIALADIAVGANILKYGQVIGRATAAIPAGAHVHVHNVEALRARGDVSGRAA